MKQISEMNDVDRLLLLQDQMESATNSLQRKSILNHVSKFHGIGAFMFAAKYLGDPLLNEDAAIISAKIALNDSSVKGSAVRAALELAKPLIHGEDSASIMTALNRHLKKCLMIMDLSISLTARI